MKPVVAIVGRPNVGKSTLFNRLVTSKKAIVGKEPGVTRDRIYSDVVWDERSITLVDTGGININDKDEIHEKVTDHVKTAIVEADVILFLVDKKDGVMPGDFEIIKMLRKTSKPLFVAVNKVDTMNHLDAAYEFYKLGIDEIYPISAMHNSGISDLMEAVIDSTHHSEEKTKEVVSKISILGRPNVGKSSILNRILGYERVIVSDIPGTTRDSIDTYVEKNGEKYLFIDTAGIRRKSRIDFETEKHSISKAIQSIEKSNISLLIIDTTDGVTNQDTRIADLINSKGKGCIILLNKWDLVDKGNEKNVKVKYEEDVRYRLHFIDYAPLLFTSASTGMGMHRLFNVIDKVYTAGGKRVQTSELNKVLSKIIHEHPPPRIGKRELRFYYITQIRTLPPTFVIFANFAEEVPDNYKRYITNRLSSTFDFFGNPVKLIIKKRL